MAMGEPTRRGRLFHWRRENGRAGEIDFVLECNNRIVPVETKSGAAGAMKSLHQFMHDKSLTLGEPVAYQLLNLPHYLAWRLPSLVACFQ